MLVGYARVSTQEQDLALQLDALRTPAASEIFEEKASGAQRERPRSRPRWARCAREHRRRDVKRC